MDKKSTTDRKSLWVLFIGLALVGVAVCGLFVLRARMLNQNATEETQRYLTEISQHMVESVNNQVKASFLVLETTAEAYAGMPPGEAADHYLKTVAKRNAFLRMGVATPDGRIATTDGRVIYVDLSKQSGISAAMTGSEKTINMVVTPMTGEVTVACGMPIRKDGAIIGVLTASTSQAVLRSYLGVESFSGAGFSKIIEGDGDIVVDTRRESGEFGNENFFFQTAQSTLDEGDSIKAMRDHMARRQTGVLGYTLSDGKRITMVYMPLAVSDWYLLSMVPYDVANAGVQSYVRLTERMDAAIIALFLLLITVVVVMLWRGQKQMERLAFVDPVTGGPNRTAFERDATVLLAASPPGSYAAISLDVQGFKLVNETYGSKLGDKTLAHVYKVLAGSLEKEELGARISGDVFNLLLKYTTRQAMEQRMELLAENINRFNMDLAEKYYLPLFQGVYVVEDPDMGFISIQDRANVARKSDKKARLGHLNTCTFYDDLSRARMRREKEIDNRVEAALANGEFIIYLQPKVELRWNTVAEAEALVRWQDPERGLIQPDEFIPLFERSGFIIKLDHYVFEQVCKLQRKWLDAGRKPMPVSLNVSRCNVENPDFLDECIAVRDRYQIPDGLLELEITESLFLENEQVLLALMERIQCAGFLCSLDDFGSGYSSLSLLRKVPADVLKLDKVFFTGTEHNSRSEHIVQSIIEMARRLKMQTVCEGVEHPAQLHFLQRVRCDMVQGFIFSRPVPIEEFEELAFSGKPLKIKELSISAEN